MQRQLITALMALVGILIATHASAAGKAVGSCKVDVIGAKSLSYEGKAYEGSPPDNLTPSSANTRGWMLKRADEIRPKSPQIADSTVKAADMIGSALTFACVSDKGTLTTGPFRGSKVTDFPSGPKKYRAVSTQGNAGDMTMMLMITTEGFPTALMPSEPGEINITQNDNEKLVGTFQFKSRDWVVKGSFNFTRPKLIE